MVGVGGIVGLVGQVGSIVVVASLGQHGFGEVGRLQEGCGVESLAAHLYKIEGVVDLGMLVGIAQVELSADESHQSRLGNLHAQIVVAVGGLLVEGAEVAGTRSVGSGQYLRHVVVFERIGQRESSHITSAKVRKVFEL